MPKRLPPQPGEWIDRSRPISFRFEGETYEGFQGDVLSSALWTNSVRLMGRSFKYHRPRSIYSLAGYDANCIVENCTQTNVRGDLLPIASGLDVRSVNTAGGLVRDRYNITEKFSRFLPVGFYYKAFHTPRRLFPVYENMMRKAAGLGRINVAARAPVLPKDYDFCELLVIGSGPAGLSAAIAAAEAGVDVLLVEEGRRIGGSLCWQSRDSTKLTELTQRAASFPNLRVRVGTQAAGCYADLWLALVSDNTLTKVRTEALLVASGCIEQPAVFRNNDLPGVMLGSAAQRLIRLYAVKPFERAVVLAANEDGYRVALDLADAGVTVAVVVDLLPGGAQSAARQAVADRRIEILSGHAIYEAVATPDKLSVQAAVVCPIGPGGELQTSDARTIPCDGIAVSVGWSPNADILAQAGAKFGYAPSVEQLIPKTLPANVFSAGRVNGVFAIDDRLAEGRRAGLAAAAFLGRHVEIPPATELRGPAPSHPYPIFPHPKKKNFVDFDEDLHLADIIHARQEGFDSVELLKRYSTVGMGPSQGKLSNMNAVRILSKLNGDSLEKTGTTTARPFHQPVSIAHLAGRRFHPHRLTPMDAWHRQAGAKMVPVGAWFRPDHYPTRGSNRDDCIIEEARTVRSGVGLIDLSTLGKLLVSGPDAAKLLEHVYTGSFANQKPGRTRYAMACDETGYVVEEGIAARLAEDRFYITASTAHGDAFYRELQRWALVFRLNVILSNVTGHLGAMNIAGKNARLILGELTNLDLSSEAFPFGHVRDASVDGVDATIMRVGFVGELSYEIHVPAHQALQVWERLFDVGKKFGIRPFGIEAQRLLRLEKGILIAGLDTDPLTTPFEAQLDWAVDINKPFFVGKRSLQIHSRRKLERKLVGFSFPKDYAGKFPADCQLIFDREKIVGRVTSIAERTTLGYTIGLAFVTPELATPGTALHIRVSPREVVDAQVAKLPFYDPENARQV